MSQALAGRGGRVLGRSLLTLANVITAAAPLAADWNDSHIFNERWPAHARFHGVTALAMSTTLSCANIWSLWSNDSGQARARFFAAAVPVAYWGPFFLAPLVPGAAVDGAGHWLRIPLGKLRNDRYVPLHPDLIQLLAAWTAANLDHIRRHKRLVADHRGLLDRHVIGRIVRRVAGAAGVAGVHPHRLRHTLATQAINRGMRLEAIAALLGHQKMEMTLIYAKIANRVVADEYAAVSAKIDALYGQPSELPADYETTGMARLRREAHARMLGNGLCTRPPELDCRLETACETCAYFRTGTQFLPILTRQRDHAQDHGQADRAALFDELIQRAATERS